MVVDRDLGTSLLYSGSGGPPELIGPGSQFAVDGSQVAFSSDQNTAVLTTPLGGVPTTLVDTSTPVPGRSGNFDGFGNSFLSLDGGVVVFSGSGEFGDFGIFANYGGELCAVVVNGTPIDGSPVTNLAFGPGAKSGNQIVFSAALADGSFGIWVASIASEMSLLPRGIALLVGALAALSLAALVRVRRSH